MNSSRYLLRNRCNDEFDVIFNALLYYRIFKNPKGNKKINLPWLEKKSKPLESIWKLVH